MKDTSQEIQIWISESLTQEERDQIANRSKEIEGCTVLFCGVNDEGKYVVIKSMTGKALATPAVEFYGHASFPDAPYTERLAKFTISAKIDVEQNPY